MKFKKDKSVDWASARKLDIKDSDGDVLQVRVVEVKKFPVVFGIEGGLSCVGMSKAKALKLAWAIIDELQPLSDL